MSANSQERIEAALQATGLPWSIENGKRHRKLYLSGRLVGVISRGRVDDARNRCTKNTIANIARQARALTNGRQTTQSV